MQALSAGDSCAIVGVGSVGKSNLLRFLLREDVQQHKLDQGQGRFLMVYVDMNKLLRRSVWGLYELMLHQLLAALTRQKADTAIRQTIEDLHDRATKQETRRLALRYLDRAIGLVCDELGKRLVFLFDEVDELARHMAPRGFVALRALRDEYKYRLMYLVATRQELKRLRHNDLTELEAFEELLTPNTIWLGAYAEPDARNMLHRLEDRNKLNLSAGEMETILEITGGHSGLLREAFSLARTRPAKLTEALINRPQVLDECQRLWLSLTASEQEALLKLTNGAAHGDTPQSVTARLRWKGIIKPEKPKETAIFSPLFAAFIRNQHAAVTQTLYIDHDRRAVWVNGYQVPKLPPLEYKFLAFLDQHRGHVCSRDDLINYLYPEETAFDGPNVPDERLNSVVKRLRQAVEPDPKNPQYVITARGHGFYLHDETDSVEKA